MRSAKIVSCCCVISEQIFGALLSIVSIQSKEASAEMNENISIRNVNEFPCIFEFNTIPYAKNRRCVVRKITDFPRIMLRWLKPSISHLEIMRGKSVPLHILGSKASKETAENEENEKMSTIVRM